MHLGETALAPLELSLIRRSLRILNGKRNLGKIKLITNLGVHRSLAFSAGKNKSIQQGAATFKGLKAQPCDFKRQHCTEFQMLNRLDADLGRLLRGSEAPFFIHMWTERAPCPSCTEVIAQFLRAYKKCRISITYQLIDLDWGKRASWRRLAGRITMNRSHAWN